MPKKSPKARPPFAPADIPSVIGEIRATVDQITAQWEIARFNMELALPLMREPSIVEGLNQTMAAHAHSMLVQTLATDVLKDCYKFALDPTERNYTVASIRTLLDKVRDQGVRAQLRTEFARIDPGMYRHYLAMFPGEKGVRYRDERIAEDQKVEEAKFDELYADVLHRADDLLVSELAERFRKARNKVIAHSEMETTRGTAKPFDIGSLGLKYGDLEAFLECAEPIVAGLETLAKAHDIDIPGTREEYREYAKRFWSLTQLGLQHADKEHL